MEKRIINWHDIQIIFSNHSIFHIGYLTAQQLVKLRNFPIKEVEIDKIKDSVKRVVETDGICLVVVENRDNLNKEKQAIIDDCLFNKLYNISGIEVEEFWELAKKPAAVEAGLAQYGRNQLVYDEFFGFDCSIEISFIYNKVINLPRQKKANWDYLPICQDCNDCKNACPAHAIHNDDTPNWLDKDACWEFCGWGNHDRITTLKYQLNNLLNNPPRPKWEIDQLNSLEDVENYFHIKWTIERCFEAEDGTKYYINTELCRECSSQPKCSKWRGEYPYEEHKKLFVLNQGKSISI